MPHLRLIRTLPLLLLAAACVDDPTKTVREPDPDPTPAPRVVGVFEITITGMAGPTGMSASVQAVPYGPSQTLSPVTFSGLTLEVISSGRFTHGARGSGQRYVTATMLVRNATGAAVQNLTFVPAIGTTTIGATPFRNVILYDGTPADSAMVAKMVPTGAVALADDGGLKATLVDVLQVFEQSELSGIPLTAPDTSLLPYGFVVRNRRNPGTRVLPSTTDPNEYAGIFTYAFRHPLPAASTSDPNSYSFRVYAVEDSETRMTESIEEAQDTAAVRMIRDRAAALGATTVTVLAGSPAAGPDVPDYPGQRQICTVRAAGPSNAPTATITEPGAYTRVMVLRPGESVDGCAAHFRSGTPARPAVGVPFTLTATAMDLYGNVMTTAVDSVRLESVSGGYATFGPRAALVSGQAAIQATYGYASYGTSVLRAVGRRNEGLLSLLVSGVTRTWTGNVSTDGANGANWDLGTPPGAQDTLYIPAGRPFSLVATASAPVGGVILDNGATFDLGSYDLTVSSIAWAGTTGGITSTTGRLILAGTGTSSIKGNLPRMQVTGSYTLAGPVISRARIELAGGRLRTVGHRLQTTSY
ncbi:MAG TPA: hypothetical protein VEQ60_32455 [Longimicrobium sp.]|nr:hypothetical protein [Longimicrobium sp.]